MTVRHTLLGLLAQKPRYGYELRADFTALAGGRENWDVSPAQIYTTLNRMLKGGLILAEPSAGDASEKQFFSLSDAGLTELNAWFNKDERPAAHQDAFYMKMMLARSLPSIETADLIQVRRSGLYRDLHRVTRAREKLDPQTELSRIMLMDKAIMHLEADLRWLDMIEARLDEVNQQPIPTPELRPRGRPSKTTQMKSGPKKE